MILIIFGKKYNLDQFKHPGGLSLGSLVSKAMCNRDVTKFVVNSHPQLTKDDFEKILKPFCLDK